MPPPADFGLSPVATLAHVSESSYAPMHRPFWTRWQEAVVGCVPKLETVTAEDPSDPTATHQIHSYGGVRLGCALVLPPKGTPAYAGVVTTHGYEVSQTLEEAARIWRHLTARGVAVLVLRVRGFPGSQLDTGDWRGDGASLGWIAHGFPACLHRPEDALPWSLPMAVADVACAARALRDWLGSRANAKKGEGEQIPVFLHGESFGGGLAVMAAAQIPPTFVRFDRLVLGVPTFGDWVWRLADPARMAFGSGGHLTMLLRSLDESAADTLMLCDAALHASKVRIATLCKLALRDEVVPAPTAAAVFNALGTAPGHKWRFLVPEAHTEPSLACARRHALFNRCTFDFLDPERDPAKMMTEWEPVLVEGNRAPTRERTPITGQQSGLFGSAPSRDHTDEVLVAAYERAARTLDDLPYTNEWTLLYAEVGEAVHMREREVFHRLHTLRKAGKLPRLGRATSRPPVINCEEESDLADLVTRRIGTLGQRDRLPFTPEFDRLVHEFNAHTGRELSPHDIWRLVAKLAK